MISYTKRYVNIISFLITIPIFLIISNINISSIKFDFTQPLFLNIFKRNVVLVELSSNNINQDTNENIKIEDNHSNAEENKLEKTNWKIIIPKISLEAYIADGTSKEVMDEYVGHFKDTSLKNGNIGLAAHNRGYAVNYFANLKKLKNGDEIIYNYKDFNKTYIVFQNIIINDTNWSYLENTEENIITLITCVENEPEYRRCVQAIEK